MYSINNQASLIVDADALPHEGVGRSMVRLRIMALAEALRTTPVCIRLGPSLAACGYELIEAMHDIGLSVCADVHLQCRTREEMYMYGAFLEEVCPEMITVSCGNSIGSMRVLKQNLSHTSVLGVTVASMNGDELFQVYGSNAREVASVFADRVDIAGFDGYLCPQAEASVLYANRERMSRTREIAIPLLIVSDVRPGWYQETQGSTVGTTPEAALGVGATHIIVGKPIVQSSHPYDAVMRTLEEIQP